MSETHGRRLRRIVTEATYESVQVDAHDDRPQDDSYQVEQLQKRAATTWSDALAAFLNAHVDYMGLTARFANQDGDTFDVPLNDSWGIEYNETQYARARALQREMSGGERPSGSSPPAAWDDPMTAMVTLTASSVPGGERLPPVDHLDAVHDSFSYDGTRDTLRSTMQYHLGLDTDEWGYWLQAEPHGVGGDGGANACYTHPHVAVYFDGAGLDPEMVGSELERVIDKHVEVCDPAGFDAHDYTEIQSYGDSDGCISVNADVSNLGSYLASYLGAGHEEELLDRPVEYLAWGAIYWATGRRRMSRSQLVNNAIAADRCDQRHESEEAAQSVAHGEQVAENTGNGQDVVCAHCESGWRVDQSRLDEVPTDDDLRDALVDDQDGDCQDARQDELAQRERSERPLRPPRPDPDARLRSRWSSADAAASAGESLAHKNARERIRRYLDGCSSRPSLPQLKGALHLSDRWDDLARSMLDGADGVPESASFDRPADPNEWELQAIVDRDGEVHAPGGGGIDMVPLHLPRKPLVDALEQRRQSVDRGSRHLRCNCGVAADPTSMASHLLNRHKIKSQDLALQVVEVEVVRF
ncbi:hypothetical protein [Halorarius halobius]|uniref:hypothetical protein n=1 Tax=Halorarius halobius TaxID=2962671 RepID=UPI0020CF58C7|nr:hypothetical protein [Halorarius halobius]